MKITRIIIGVALLAALAAAGLSLSTEKTPDSTAEVLTAKAAEMDFRVVVNTVGYLDAARSTVIVSSIRGDRGKIINIVESGTRVQKGDVLIQLDPTPFEEEVRKLESQVREAEAEVQARSQLLHWEENQADSSIKTAEFDLRAAELDLLKLEKGDGPLELARLDGAAQEAKTVYDSKVGYLKDLGELKKRGFATDTEINLAQGSMEDAQKAYEVARKMYETHRDFVLPFQIEQAKAKVARSRMGLEQTKKGAGFKIGQAMADQYKAREKLSSLQTALNVAREDLTRAVIQAPIPGLVVLRERYVDGQKRKPRVGDKVLQGQPLMYLPDVSSMIVETRIREVDLHKVSVGTPAVVTVDAYPDLRLPGKVHFIGVLAESRPELRGADKYFQLTVLIEEGDPRLRPGMTARLEIQCGEVDDVLSVPIQAVFHEKGRRFTYVKTGAGFEKREIQVGVQNEERVEIRRGMRSGERVALSLPAEDSISGTRDLPVEER